MSKETYLYVISKSTLMQETISRRGERRDLDTEKILNFFEMENENLVEAKYYWQPLSGWRVDNWPDKMEEMGWDFRIPVDGLFVEQMTAGQRLEISAMIGDALADLHDLAIDGEGAKFIFIAHTLDIIPLLKEIESTPFDVEVEVWCADPLKDGGHTSKYILGAHANVKDWTDLDRYRDS